MPVTKCFLLYYIVSSKHQVECFLTFANILGTMVKFQFLFGKVFFVAVPLIVLALFLFMTVFQSFSNVNGIKEYGPNATKLTVDQRICVFQALASDESVATSVENCRKKNLNLKCISAIPQLRSCFD